MTTKEALDKLKQINNQIFEIEKELLRGSYLRSMSYKSRIAVGDFYNTLKPYNPNENLHEINPDL